MIVNASFFNRLCKSRCSNYGRKYSCPPFSPSFTSVAPDLTVARVLCLRLKLEQFSPISIHMCVRAGNAVLKPLLDHELASWQALGFRVGGSGSCRACKPCAAKTQIACRKPTKRIYSLEAMGIDVCRLVHGCFGFSLQWYSPGKTGPEFTCTVGAILGHAQDLDLHPKLLYIC